MKLLLILCLLFSMACTESTPYGECIGAFDTEDPALNYRISTLNTVLAIIFFETIIVPIVVVAYEVKCPTSVKKEIPNGDRR
jgi:hypothetical protein